MNIESVEIPVTVLKSKIHRVSITESNVDYVGSLTVDRDLLDVANMYEFERVSVVNINNGQRFDTYLINGTRGSGEICLNGAAARLGLVGDKIIIMSFTQLPTAILKKFKPTMIVVDQNNRAMRIEQCVGRATLFDATQ
jgi:aspartate 1-decarboxylase